jgi:hypothetical protein
MARALPVGPGREGEGRVLPPRRPGVLGEAGRLGVGVRAARSGIARYLACRPRRLAIHTSGDITARTSPGATGASTSGSNARMNIASSSGLGIPLGNVRPSRASAATVSNSSSMRRAGRTSTRSLAGRSQAFANRCDVPAGTITSSPDSAVTHRSPFLNRIVPLVTSNRSSCAGWT